MVPGIGIGRAVHFIPGKDMSFKDDKRHIAATIVSVCSPDEEGMTGLVNLRLHMDGTNDHQHWKDFDWHTSVVYDETGTKPYSWHWPEGSPTAVSKAKPAPTVGTSPSAGKTHEK